MERSSDVLVDWFMVLVISGRKRKIHMSKRKLYVIKCKSKERLFTDQLSLAIIEPLNDKDPLNECTFTVFVTTLLMRGYFF